jgi:pyruvate/2-oxoglutarate dehydrogenase complex dihydrolipoamide dehydrogenase (E3) component
MGLHMASKGHKVTVVEMLGKLSPESVPVHFRSLLEAKWENEPNFSYILNARVSGIRDGKVFFTKDGTEQSIPADNVVLAAGMKSRSDEAMTFFTGATRVHMIGDCDKVGSIQTAMRAAFALASNI